MHLMLNIRLRNLYKLPSTMRNFILIGFLSSSFLTITLYDCHLVGRARQLEIALQRNFYVMQFALSCRLIVSCYLLSTVAAAAAKVL